MDKSNDLTTIYRKYKGLWVVLNATMTVVVSANKSAKKAYHEAIKKGYDRPTLFKVPEKNLPYVGWATEYDAA